MQQPYHHLLEKQIQNSLSGAQKYDPAVQKLLKLVDQTYRNYEQEQQQTEHAFKECEKEYQHIFQNQQLQNTIYSQSVQQLKNAIIAHDPKAAVILEKEGNVLMHIISYLEKQIQERKETDAELIRAKEQAEDGARAKSDFLSVMSHEIRTPLNAIIGIAHLLLQEQLLPSQLENLKALNTSAENLLRLINDILDFGKIEEGKIVLAEKNTCLKQLAENIRTAHQIRASERGNTINMMIDDALPFILSDEVRLGQILHNLVSNAVKFTRNGVITLKMSLQKLQDDEVTVYFSVADTGVGIEKDKQVLIFDRFTQAHVDIAREFGGSGLGLAIVKRLADLYNSDIHVNSEPGRGSTFFFTITFKKGKAEVQPQQAVNGKNDLSGIKVLLVEDVEFNIMVAKKMITNWNGAVDIAENGAVAINKVQQSEYDIVLMDLQMPVMDGYNATQYIRNFNDDIPIIALTASASSDILQRTREFGMTDYLAKPFKPGELYEMISKYSKRQ
jgi:signal transduction histidine kinase/CheY-like chemotaxis protein